MKTFEELAAFKRAMELVQEIYAVTESFPRSEQYGLTSQIRRASTSVVNHIAEGQGRLTAGEWRQMLSQARGSLYEVEAQLLVATMLRFMDDETFARVRLRAKKVGHALSGLIDYVRNREKPHAGRSAPRQPATG
jgi:four helix bundle protein